MNPWCLCKGSREGEVLDQRVLENSSETLS